jgi:hypothetical protein
MLTGLVAVTPSISRKVATWDRRHVMNDLFEKITCLMNLFIFDIFFLYGSCFLFTTLSLISRDPKSQ